MTKKLTTMLGVAVLGGALMIGCPRVGGVTPEGRYFGKSLIFNVIDRELGINQYERHDTQTQNSYAGLSSDEVALLKMPRVVYRGVNNEGIHKWSYYDGKGNKYSARMGFENKNGVTGSSTKKGEFTKRSFAYVTPTGTHMRVPENALVIE